MAEGKPPYGDIHPMRAIFMIPTKPPPSFREPDQWSPEFIDFVSRYSIMQNEMRIKFFVVLLTMLYMESFVSVYGFLLNNFHFINMSWRGMKYALSLWADWGMRNQASLHDANYLLTGCVSERKYHFRYLAWKYCDSWDRNEVVFFYFFFLGALSKIRTNVLPLPNSFKTNSLEWLNRLPFLAKW